MSVKSVLITGSNGGIGQALCSSFTEAGWRVIATDLHSKPKSEVEHYLGFDLAGFATDAVLRQRVEAALIALLPSGLDCLINNGAYQVVASLGELSVEDWHRSMHTNVNAPFLLVKALLGCLERANGNVINITSVHANLTKPNFSAYATSKAALEGLTRSLAVELGSRVRVNAIAPAAISTPMLVAGFAGNDEKAAALDLHHPTARIGAPEELARLAIFIAENDNRFLNGAVVGLDGGIASRLHDPM
jgi:NAD(P)-dependent dehydrogenase (short-subunit alcohol dehydrogenase family)